MNKEVVDLVVDVVLVELDDVKAVVVLLVLVDEEVDLVVDEVLTDVVLVDVVVEVESGLIN